MAVSPGSGRRARRCKPYFQPLHFEVSWRSGQLLWLSHHCHAVSLLRAGLWCNSKGWEGWPQAMCPYVTVPHSHPALGHLTRSAGGAQYRVALLRFMGRSDVRGIWGGAISLPQQIGRVSLSWPKYKWLSVQYCINSKLSANKKGEPVIYFHWHHHNGWSKFTQTSKYIIVTLKRKKTTSCQLTSLSGKFSHPESNSYLNTVKLFTAVNMKIIDVY